MESNQIVFAESVALQSVDANGALHDVFEVDEAEHSVFAVFFLVYQPQFFEPRKRPENVRNFSFRGVQRNALDVNDVGRVVF
jgi:hypothetical protein